MIKYIVYLKNKKIITIHADEMKIENDRVILFVNLKGKKIELGYFTDVMFVAGEVVK